MSLVSQYRGTSPVMTPPGAGGEGPWVYSGFCEFVLLDGALGDRWLIWTDGAVSAVYGPAEVHGPASIGAGIGDVEFTGTGEAYIGNAQIIAHRPTLLTVTECS